jgi:hypothetical protein
MLAFSQADNNQPLTMPTHVGAISVILMHGQQADICQPLTLFAQ